MLGQSMKRTVAVAIAVLIAGGVLWLVRPGSPRPPQTAAPTPNPAGQIGQAASSSPRPSASPSPSCDKVARAFDPRTIAIPGVTKGASVVTPARTANGVPGAPPPTSAGKSVFAWDREQGIRPGDPAGNVLLNTHTWPDGSALGNRLLAGLQRGDRIVVLGVTSRLCYRVTERVEVLAAEGLPRYYARNGPPQLAIVVCSGRRLGPGEWEKRTVWFASPSR
jgi:hypothetical protein